MHHVLEVGAGLQLGGQPARAVRSACSTRTAWAATSAITSASACWSSVSGPGRSQYRLSAPRRTAPTWSGKPKTARTPASRAGPAKAEPSGRDGFARSGSSTGPVLVVGVHAGPLAEVVLQLLDERAHLVGGAHRAPGHVAGHQHDPRAAHAGDLGAHLAQPLRLQLGSPRPPPSRARIRSRRSPAIAHGPLATFARRCRPSATAAPHRLGRRPVHVAEPRHPLEAADEHRRGVPLPTQQPMAGGAREGVVAVVPGLAHAEDGERGDVAAAVLRRERSSAEHVAQRVDAPRRVVQDADPHEAGPEQRARGRRRGCRRAAIRARTAARATRRTTSGTGASITTMSRSASRSAA